MIHTALVLTLMTLATAPPHVLSAGNAAGEGAENRVPQVIASRLNQDEDVKVQRQKQFFHRFQRFVAEAVSLKDRSQAYKIAEQEFSIVFRINKRNQYQRSFVEYHYDSGEGAASNETNDISVMTIVYSRDLATGKAENLDIKLVPSYELDSEKYYGRLCVGINNVEAEVEAMGGDPAAVARLVSMTGAGASEVAPSSFLIPVNTKLYHGVLGFTPRMKCLNYVEFYIN